MFGKILGKTKQEADKNQEHTIVVEKIAKMNLSDMRIYVNNKLTGFGICEDGLNEVMRKLISKNDNNQRFIEIDAMDTKKKKAFDLVIMISESKKVTIVTVELMQEFIVLYKDLIDKFDQENKQIYGSRLNTSIANAVETIAVMSEVNRKTKILGV